MATDKVGVPEEWRAVKGYEGRYEVSSHGRVRSLPRRYVNSLGIKKRVRGVILRPGSNYGYPHVMLYSSEGRATFRVHELVARAFLGDAPGEVGAFKGGFQVNHKDGVKTNNAATNLEWVTREENMAHAMREGLWARGVGKANAKLNPYKVREIRRVYASGVISQQALADRYGVSRSVIQRVINRTVWTHVNPNQHAQHYP